VTNERILEDLASRDGVSKKKGKVAKSLPQEVAFLNRCVEFLAPNGKLAIVLPDGVLSGSSMQFVREWLLRQARIRAVVSLPSETFAPFGAGVKTSILVLEKREQSLIDLDADEYDVFMAKLGTIGYDATGRSNVPESDAPYPPEAQDMVRAFHEELGWE
jgi:type I restriction enzyme M protein